MVKEMAGMEEEKTCISKWEASEAAVIEQIQV